MSIDKKLLEILVCPVDKADLEYDAQNQKLTCTQCRRVYPIRDGIPIMLESEAEQPA